MRPETWSVRRERISSSVWGRRSLARFLEYQALKVISRLGLDTDMSMRDYFVAKGLVRDGAALGWTAVGVF